MYLIIALILVIIGFILLTKGADYFIENSATLAEEKGLSPHVVGVTIVAFGTSLPELLVSIISSLQNHNDLALGNIVGSNISNIGLVLASTSFVFYYILGSMIYPSDNANKDSYIMLFAALLLLLFAQDNLISFSEGLLFFILYILIESRSIYSVLFDDYVSHRLDSWNVLINFNFKKGNIGRKSKKTIIFQTSSH